jgi:hypothetical protein
MLEWPRWSVDLLHVPAIRDEEGGAGVPEAVEAQPLGDAGGEDGRLEVAAVEVPLPDGAALGHGEHEPGTGQERHLLHKQDEQRRR